MRIWDLPVQKAFHFSLAADSRFCNINPYNDQVWEFHCASKEPPALTMHTTYGLRAQSMRIFPRFILNETDYLNPFEFFETPKLQYLFTNYFSLVFSPFEDILIQKEVLVTDSESITGRYLFSNQGNKVVTLRFDLAFNLKPFGSGENMSPDVWGNNTILTGSTHDLYVAAGLSGNSQPNQSPYPSLSQDVQIVPGKSRLIQWALVSSDIQENSLKHMQKLLSMAWEPEVARILMSNESQLLDIHTGNHEWDFLLAESQRNAHSFVMDGKGQSPAFVTNRTVDMGYSFAEDGKQLISSWKIQSALDAYYLTGFLLPGRSQSVRNILDHFLEKYTDPNDPPRKIDQPVLCTIAFDYYKATKDLDWVKEHLPILERFLSFWFSSEYDRDQDGFPEWSDTAQSGLEENPSFSRWKPETQGLSIYQVESPSLAAFLYNECKSLLYLSKICNQNEDLHPLTEKMQQLKKYTEECWHDKVACFIYRDYETHLSQKGKLLIQTNGNTNQTLKKSFSKPQRLLLHILGKDDTRPKFRIILKGKNQKNYVEDVIDYYNVSWLHGRAYYTTNQVYTRLESVEIEGVMEDDTIELFCADHFMLDISLLLPIWAQNVSTHRANKLIDKTIAKTFWGKYGLPIAPQTHDDFFLAKPPKVIGIWNQLIGEGLIHFNKIDLACSLFTNLMAAATRIYYKDFSFHESYHAQTAEPSGEIGHLKGIPPLSLFLETLGVKYVYNNQVVLTGNNPFPWPVTVKYKGTTITRHDKDTVVTFSSGHTITVSGSDPQEVRLVQDNIIE